MKKVAFLGLLIILIGLGFIKGMNTHAKGGSYSLNWFTVDGGGSTFLQGGEYALGSTVGQPDAGSLSGGDYTVQGGFWHGVTATPTPTVTPSITPTPTATPTVTATPEVSDYKLFLPVIVR